jgi:hypothetical protein
MTTTVGSLIRVWTDVGTKKPVPLLAKVVEKDGRILVIRYLTEEDGVWRYEDETYEVEDCPESVAERLNTFLEEDIGFKCIDDGFIKVESDDDYIPDSDEEENEDDEDEDDETEEDEEDEEELDDDVETEEDEEEENVDEY